MKLQKLFLSAAGMSVILFTSCRTEDPGNDGFGDVSSTAQMVVPESFDYNTTKTVNFDFATETVWGKQKIRLDIYDFMPTADGEIVSSLFANGYGQVDGSVNVPSSLKELYVMVTYPDGSSETAKVKINGNQASYSFTRKNSGKKAIIVSPDCANGCAVEVNHNSSWYAATNGGVYCFTGNIKGAINVKNGSTVRICGSGAFQLSVESNGKVEIADGANVTITNFDIKPTAESVVIYPNANVAVTNWATPSADIVNYGNLSFQGLGINAQCDFTNYGTTRVLGSNWYSVAGNLINEGVFSYAGNLTQNAGGSITNYCNMSVNKQLQVDGTFKNHSYLNIEGTLRVNSAGSVKLFDGAMARAQDIFLDGTLEGAGSTSLVKLNDQLVGNSTAQIRGNLEFCDANGVEATFAGLFVAPASQSCGTFIPVTPCNPEGNGNPQFDDSDADGVVDNMDMFPYDPAACGASFYPSDRSYATLLFEDLWPGRGDYDFNDLVLGYSHMLVTNANNEVVRMESKFVVKAIGGSLKNGFGFQLDLAPSEVTSVSGQLLTKDIVSLASNGTEQNQSKATIIVFDNAFATVTNAGGTKYVNTISSEPGKDTDTLRIITTFTNPQAITALGEGPFNPFIFINEDRGRELHLVNNPPTDRVNISYFQSASDDSDPASGRYYKSQKGHPWALNIKGDIKHMEEKTDIVEGYILFADWAQSGGGQAIDWYIDHVGYRDQTKLY